MYPHLIVSSLSPDSVICYLQSSYP